MTNLNARMDARELPLLTITAAANRACVARTSVVQAISVGRLPVYVTRDVNGHFVRLVRPEDVDALWSVRKHPLKHAVSELTELINA